MNIGSSARVFKSPFLIDSYSIQSSIIGKEHELAFRTLSTAPFGVQMLHN
jgi:hypothetical protein